MQKRVARRTQMMETAMRLVREEGIGAVTVYRLAKELGQSVSILYRYFPGKAGLLVALQEHAIDAWEGEVDRWLRETDEALSAVPIQKHAAHYARILAVLSPFIEGYLNSPARHRLIDELMSSPEQILSAADLKLVNERLKPLLDKVSTVLDQAVAARVLDPGDSGVRARLFWAAFHGIDHLRKRDRGEPASLRSDVLLLEMIRNLLRGFGASNKQLEVALSYFLAGRGTRSGPRIDVRDDAK